MSSTEKNRKIVRRENPERLHRPKGKNYLLAIGINEYVHCPTLNNAVNDVKEFQAIMVDKYQFESGNVVLLLNQDATKAAIFKAFKSLKDKVKPQDSLVIYFSGHGEYLADWDEGYWIPVEAKRGAEEDYISNSDILKRLNAINSWHTFMISDACFSGGILKGATRKVAEYLEKDNSRWALTSGKNEVVPDGIKGEHSPFAKHLLKVLNNNVESLGVLELGFKVAKLTISDPDTTQTPVIEPLKIRNHEFGQFVFHLKKDEIRDWLTAKAKNTAEAFANFLVMYPQGKYTAEAKKLKYDLEEQTAWNKAQSQNTITIYFKYIDTFPNGKNLTHALAKISLLEEDQHWNDAVKKNTITGFYKYLEQHPNGLHSQLAQENIQKLRDDNIKKEITVPHKEPLKEVESLKSERREEEEKISTFDWKKITSRMPLLLLGGLAGILLILFLIFKGIGRTSEPEYPPKPFEYGKGKDSRLIGMKGNDGNWVIPPVYFTVKIFSQGLASVDSNNSWGYINEKGEKIIDYQYLKAEPFAGDLAVVCMLEGTKEKCGFIDKTGKVVIPLIYDGASSFDGAIAWVKKDGEVYYINKNGDCVGEDCPE